MTQVAVKHQICFVPVEFTALQGEQLEQQSVQVESMAPWHDAEMPVASETSFSGCSIISMAAESTAQVKLVRRHVGPDSPLFATSSNEELVRIESPLEGEPVAPAASSALVIKAAQLTGKTPDCGLIEVRYGAIDGPVIGKLGVYVMPLLRINLQAHVLRVSGNHSVGMGTTKPPFPFKQVLEQVKAFWLQYGICINIAAPRELNLALTKNNSVDVNEINKVVNAGFTQNHINLYFIPHLSGTEESALTFTPGSYQGYCLNGKEALKRPGVFMATDVTASSVQHARLLAQQLGLFMGLDFLSIEHMALSLTFEGNLMHRSKVSQAMPYLTLKTLSFKSEQGETVKVASQCLAVRTHIASEPKKVYG